MISTQKPVLFRGNVYTVPTLGSSRVLSSLDYAQTGQSSTNQNKLIYGMNIVSRLAAARGWNEFGEIGRRDILGWLFWFYTTPLIQRAVIACAPKEVRQALLTQTPKPEGGGLKQLLWRFNPLVRWHLTSLPQIKDYIQNPLYKEQLPFLYKVRNWRAGAAGVGLGIAMLALGVGINLLNIAITRKNVQAGKSFQAH